MKTQAIGQLKVKKTVYCTLCGCSNTRNIAENIFANTTEEIEKAKKQLTLKANKEYTCNICKSILKTNS